MKKTLKGKLFKLRILGSDSTPIALLCRHDYQKLFGFGHTQIDNIKNYMLKLILILPVAYMVYKVKMVT